MARHLNKTKLEERANLVLAPHPQLSQLTLEQPDMIEVAYFGPRAADWLRLLEIERERGDICRSKSVRRLIEKSL